jgi:hypothetical protein
MCAFFHNRDDEYQVLLRFVEEGLGQGDRGFHIVDPARQGAQALVDVIRSHPRSLLFVGPDEFLRELRRRQGHRQPGSPR